MNISTRLLYGNTISQNNPPSQIANAKIKLNGAYNGKPNTFTLDNDVLSKHTMLVGGTGCGKTTLFYHFVSQIKRNMTNDDVMIIFDSKGDFYSQFYNKSTDLVIGNSKQYSSISQHWNIYKEILADGWDKRDYIINTQEICKSFFDERTKNTTNAFFPNAARDMLAAVITVFIREGEKDASVKREWFYNNKLKEWLEQSDSQRIMDLLSESPDANAVLSYISGDNAQSQGVLSEMYSVIREILIGVFAEKGSFSMREFVRNKGNKTLFIEYDLSIGSMLTPVYRLMFDLALKEALGRNKPQGNVYLVCDEFKLLPHLRHIDDGVNFGRSLGVKVFAGIQSIEQLYEIYGQSRGRNIAAGFSSVYAFRANDVSTRDYITGLFGKNIVLEKYQRLDNQITEEKRNGQTVEDWDMNSLKVGEAIVGLPFSQPFRFYFDMY
ncbi:MAG: type IV secretion system DNA-binding domain-containing protein [Chitinispirillales bacterium]|jgi:type IV secretory pathway TraG/TraD family ATPase VirD4|nr:type IV secretion system DNA-binding domain-containing protein [Chitinispirillales bacterium]